MDSFLFNQIYKNKSEIQDHLQFLDGSDDLTLLFDVPGNLSNDRLNLYKRLYHGIGNTACYIVNLPNHNKLHIKMEYANSMGNSHYARYWISLLYIAEMLNLITPGKSKIIEVTSGSSGIALAMASNRLNYESHIIVPDILPDCRIEPMIDYGANLIIVKGYIDNCVDKLLNLVDDGGYFPPNHSEEKLDIITKIFSRIAYEYIRDHDCPDYAILGLGNGTTTSAIFNQFKNEQCRTKCISYHPSLDKKQLVFGLYGPNVKLRHVKIADELTDEKIYTNDIKLETVKDYFKYDTEICNLGPSSMYGITIAFELSKKVQNKTFFTIGYDKNDRY